MSDVILSIPLKMASLECYADCQFKGAMQDLALESNKYAYSMFSELCSQVAMLLLYRTY